MSARNVVNPATAYLARFFVGTLVVSVSFWSAGAVFQTSLLTPELPVSALMFTAPSVGLLGAVGFRPVWGALRAKISSAQGTVASAAVWLPVMPLIVLATSHHTRSGGVPVPPGASLLLLSAGLVISSMLEQLGWMWFAAHGLARRWGVWPASVTTGAFWAALHVVPWLQAGHDGGWVIGQTTFSVVFFCVIVQAYLPHYSLLTAIAIQWSYDATWVWVRSIGATYDPVATTLVTTALLIAAASQGRRRAPRRCCSR